jgi:hypothetical protein
MQARKFPTAAAAVAAPARVGEDRPVECAFENRRSSSQAALTATLPAGRIPARVIQVGDPLALRHKLVAANAGAPRLLLQHTLHDGSWPVCPIAA